MRQQLPDDAYMYIALLLEQHEQETDTIHSAVDDAAHLEELKDKAKALFDAAKVEAMASSEKRVAVLVREVVA